ncbi:hypothetical protein CC78DRAFT_313134 [Lojkania enalia]|uniref:Uncharacterized protein n=1 Tax=Lojkania enalia TaxID=147567 RepID=A0A9P4K5S7_9PLEO|nr:hypothetical protein CC78DRAFT_313134 [Didymosphaeria enalia]
MTVWLRIESNDCDTWICSVYILSEKFSKSGTGDNGERRTSQKPGCINIRCRMMRMRNDGAFIALSCGVRFACLGLHCVAILSATARIKKGYLAMRCACRKSDIDVFEKIVGLVHLAVFQPR